MTTLGSMADLIEHEGGEGGYESPIRCSYCGKEFHSDRALNVHVMEEHQDTPVKAMSIKEKVNKANKKDMKYTWDLAIDLVLLAKESGASDNKIEKIIERSDVTEDEAEYLKNLDIKEKVRTKEHAKKILEEVL